MPKKLPNTHIHSILSILLLACVFSLPCLREGLEPSQTKPISDDQYIDYHEKLKDREDLRTQNMTVKQTYLDQKQSLSINIIRIVIMILFILGLLFSFLQLDTIKNMLFRNTRSYTPKLYDFTL